MDVAVMCDCQTGVIDVDKTLVADVSTGEKVDKILVEYIGEYSTPYRRQRP